MLFCILKDAKAVHGRLNYYHSSHSAYKYGFTVVVFFNCVSIIPEVDKYLLENSENPWVTAMRVFGLVLNDGTSGTSQVINIALSVLVIYTLQIASRMRENKFAVKIEKLMAKIFFPSEQLKPSDSTVKKSNVAMQPMHNRTNSSPGKKMMFKMPSKENLINKHKQNQA